MPFVTTMRHVIPPIMHLSNERANRMSQELDYAKPESRPGAWGTRLVPVFFVTVVAVFALSMGFWSRQFTGWSSPGRFNIDATRTEWGLPAWLSVCRVRSTGAAPPINSPALPAAGGFQAGWHVAPGALCLSVAGCLAVGGANCAIVWGLRRRGPVPARGPLAWAALGAVAAAGGAAAWFTDPAPDPQNVLLMFVAMPLAVFVGASFVRTYAGGVLLAAAATAAYWWVLRMESLRTPTDGRFDPDEVQSMSLMFLVGLAVAVGAVFVARRRAQVSVDAQEKSLR